jgi:hypothetical protein
LNERLGAVAQRVPLERLEGLERALGPTTVQLPGWLRTQPIVYAWINPGGAVHYIGVSRRGIERVVAANHRALRDVQADDLLCVWAFGTEAEAQEAERVLLALVAPEWNRHRPGTVVIPVRSRRVVPTSSLDGG